MQPLTIKIKDQDYVAIEFYSLATDFLYQGAQLGMSEDDVYAALAVELAIESGDIPLPWSQEECEENLPSGPLEITYTLDLMKTQPEFTPIACAWAYTQDEFIFYRFNPQEMTK